MGDERKAEAWPAGARDRLRRILSDYADRAAIYEITTSASGLEITISLVLSEK